MIAPLGRRDCLPACGANAGRHEELFATAFRMSAYNASLGRSSVAKQFVYRSVVIRVGNRFEAREENTRITARNHLVGARIGIWMEAIKHEAVDLHAVRR